MRVGMVLHTGFPPDIRVAKEIQSLQEEHDVYLLCVRRGMQAKIESVNGVAVKRIFSRGQRVRAYLSLLSRRRSKSWQRAVTNFVDENGIEVLHVHDLPLLGVGLTVGRRFNIPVISDLHENYPAMLEAQIPVSLVSARSIQQVVLRLVVSVKKWATYERETVAQADRVITVIDEARERLVELGVLAEKIDVIGNYASLDGIGEKHGLSEDNFTLVYAGGFGATRDLSTLIKSVSLLDKKKYPNVKVILVGGKGRAYANLRKLANDLDVSDRVQVLRWLPQAEAEQLMLDADVGVVPHVKSPHTDATIPHKLFQYMWRRLPVIVSDCAPLQRIVSENRCGLVYRSGDAEALAKCIVSLYRDRELTQRMGAAGARAVEETYNWNAAGETLCTIYRRLKAESQKPCDS